MAGCSEPTQVHWKPWDRVPGKAGNGRIKRMLQKQVRAIALKHDNDVIYIPAWWVRSLCIPSLDKENYYYPAFLTSSLFILLHSFHSYGTLGWVLWLELANPVPRATKFFFLFLFCVFTRFPWQPHFFLINCSFFPYGWVFRESQLSSGFPLPPFLFQMLLPQSSSFQEIFSYSSVAYGVARGNECVNRKHSARLHCSARLPLTNCGDFLP